MQEKIAIIGGGGTGAALAYDLALRGFRVSLFEAGEFFSGTTGRHHGLLHSGARYAVNDQEAARECIEENLLLKKLVPQAVENNGGLFVAIDEEDLEFASAFEQGCEAAGIEAIPLAPRDVLEIEPNINPKVIKAYSVPDATIDAYRLPLSFLTAALKQGAEAHRFTQIKSIKMSGSHVVALNLLDHKSQKEFSVSADMVINATGAWSGKIAAMAGVDLPIQPGPGIMIANKGRLCHRVINRLRPAGEGDIIVPQRQLSISGTSLWLDSDPDNITLPYEDVPRLQALCAEMIPAIAEAGQLAVWAASRPLIANPNAPSAQEISRSFDCFDHEKTHGIKGLISIIGGKATTLRAMAEKTANIVCDKLGRQVECRTKEQVLPSYHHFYSLFKDIIHG